MSMDSGLVSNTPYFDAVSVSLPSVLSDLLMSFDTFSRDKLDTLVRFCAGGTCPTRIAGHADAWTSGQSRLNTRLAQLEPSTGAKRARPDDHDRNGANSLVNGNAVENINKRTKLSESADDGQSRYTLHSLSITAPIRKKVDVSISDEAIRLTHPATAALEARIPLTTIKRAFIASYLGKNRNKEQWAVTLLSADSFDKKADPNTQTQLTFNIDKVVPGGKDGFKTSVGNGAKQVTHAKGNDTLHLLQEFLGNLPPFVKVHITDKNLDAFKSSSGQPYVDAYLGAKEGALYFLPQGILWANARPCEFYALEDLAPDSDTPGLGGVKTLSATGRTFSVFIRRRVASVGDDDEGGDDDEEEEECEETEFAMIDGRELENVNGWIRKYRKAFGRPPLTEDTTKGEQTLTGDVKGKGKARAERQEVVPTQDDDSDESDEDYAAPSDSDGGEPSSDSEDEDGEDGAEGDDQEDTDESDDERGENEDEELDPAKHPLLRPGAMPKMSKAAMDAAIQMVMQDVLGSGDENEEEDVDELE